MRWYHIGKLLYSKKFIVFWTTRALRCRSYNPELELCSRPPDLITIGKHYSGDKWVMSIPLMLFMNFTSTRSWKPATDTLLWVTLFNIWRGISAFFHYNLKRLWFTCLLQIVVFAPVFLTMFLLFLFLPT